MRFLFTLLLSSASLLSFAQGLNYSPARQLVRLDLGMTIFSDIDKVGGYAGAAYEYSFMNHFGADVHLNTSLHHPTDYIGNHASRWGVGLNLIGRLYGLKSPYDVKFTAGARYGSHFYTELEEQNGVIVAVDGERRSGFYPVLGAGYEQRLGDWLLTLEFNVAFESNVQTFTSLAIGTGYRF
ncbi:hypothetical protein [Phaeocystidibacter luteus]|uniref:Porin family protein n=1 Tax=Phaeocystidibacter luteus TaxID=911197 RepID=A0A6N6RMJ8_9FLAO|nr:hypothetical protein [Phaeocystidibacter luteus]KAB2814810.1 hypothetical protein F8C67_03415 [Phaeocystidibacter luteus]